MSREKVNDVWTVYDPPWVEEIPDEPMRYWVDSGSTGRRHLVDLSERDGLGMCGCEFYQYTAYPNWKRHGLHIPYEPKRIGVSECKHIRAALDHWDKYYGRVFRARFKDGVPAE